MPEPSNRNMFAFMALAVLILLGYQFFVMEPQQRKAQEAEAARLKLAPAPAANMPTAGAAPVRVTRAQAIAASPRVPVDTPTLTGSISLKGARLDDLHLKNYRQTLDKKDPVELFRPDGVEFAHFAEFGWNGPNVPGLPTRDTVWTVAQGAALTPTTPLVLTYDNGAGLRFTRTISVDKDYLFTVADTVANTGAAPVQIAPYASVQRQGFPKDVGHNQIVHEGGIGVLGTDKYELIASKDLKYPNWQKKPKNVETDSKGGWLGLTDKYWLAALVPDQKEAVKTQFRATSVGGVDVFDASYVGAARTIPAGMQVSETTHLFAGAKVVPLLKTYQKALGAPRFDDAVDWGMFWFFTRPIFTVLEFIFKNVGNFGLAIIGLTIIVRLLLYPLADKSYESMTKMKKAQPKVEELKTKYANDPAKMQQETMALYQREKINPLTGCLPIFLQIPILYSLYKVLTVTLEMRHAPFFAWMRDLSARDPTTLWNLFGLLPYDPAHIAVVGPLLDGQLHLSVLALLYGFSMWLSQSMNPPQGDPTQKLIFQLMPVILTLTLSGVASGLLVYWIWSNLLTILQQYVMMRKFGVENPIDNFLARIGGKAKAAAG